MTTPICHAVSQDLVGLQLANEIAESKKNLSIMVDLIKAHKAWIRKGADSTFLEERPRLNDFEQTGATRGSCLPTVPPERRAGDQFLSWLLAPFGPKRRRGHGVDVGPDLHGTLTTLLHTR